RLRDEVVAAGTPGDAATTPPAELAPPAPEQVAAGAALADRIDAAIAAGRWTDDDVAFLRASAAATRDDEYAAGLQRLASAVNRGDVRVETAGAPF
ncbi:MAG TPA: hypothetical protein VL463_14130, partial [Kofleriaceae bacterium]|nr:hypothetical protein [Kofleriaceae bacterium]